MQIGLEVEYMNITIKERFERKISPEPNSGCHLWIGSCNTASKTGNGHGRFRIGEKAELAHRVAYELYAGPIPDGIQVLHKCDNPPCVNPDHLFLGTHQDNMDDMNEKGRAVVLKREAHGMAKLNMEKAQEIRRLHASGYSSRALAQMYGVTRRTIQNVYQNKLWQQECHD